MRSYFKNHYWVKKNRVRLISERGYRCEKCGAVPLKLDQHHKDGNKDNHEDSNIELLCPKCHGETRTGISTKHSKAYVEKREKQYLISTPFQNAVKKNRVALLDAGYKASTLTMWAYGKRHPRYKTAEKLVPLIGLHLHEIPWMRLQIND